MKTTKTTKTTKKSSKSSTVNPNAPKNLELRGHSYYYRKMVDGTRVCVPLGTRDEATAILMAKGIDRKYELAALGIQDPVEKTYTWAQAWNLFETLAAVDLSANSLRSYRQRWTRCTQLFTAKGITTIGALTTLDINLVRSELSKGIGTKSGKPLAPRTINSILKEGGEVVFHMLQKNEAITSNPFDKVDRMDISEEDQNKTRFLDWDSVVQLLEVSFAHGRDMHLVCLLGGLAGMRRTEILRARWSHVKWDSDLIFVDGHKTKSSHADIPMLPELKAALARYAPVNAEKCDEYIVRPDHTEWPDSATATSYRWAFSDIFDKMLKRSNMPDITPHALRHSVAQRMYDNGYTLQQVARFLRHGNTKATARYARTSNVPLFTMPSLGDAPVMAVVERVA